MLSHLREIYSKKSPIFLIEIIMIVITCLIMKYQCTCWESLPLFYLLTLIISSLEVVFKSLVLSLVHVFNKEAANTLQYVFVAIFMLLHLATWIFSIITLTNDNFRASCSQEEPHYFYMKIYVAIYAIVLVGGLAVLILLMLPVTVVTLFSFKGTRNES